MIAISIVVIRISAQKPVSQRSKGKPLPDPSVPRAPQDCSACWISRAFFQDPRKPIKQDRILAETLPEIDLIIGGHTHVVLPDGIQVGKTLIVQGGARGQFVGRIEVEKAASGEGSLRIRASLEPL